MRSIPGRQTAERYEMDSERPVRILHFVSTFAGKTDTRWLVQLLGALDDDRFESHIAAMYGPEAVRTAFEQAGAQTYTINAPRAVSPLALWRCWRLIRRVRPDIVHTHLLRSDLYGAAAARLAGVPAVLTSKYALGQYSRATRRLSTHALAVSEAVRSDLVERLGWDAQRVSTIHTGYDFEAAPTIDPEARARLRALWSVPLAAPVVVALARLSYEKGLDVLIRAARLVRRQIPEARFVIAGEGPLRAELERLISELDLTGTVLLAGWQPDVRAVLSAADLFAMPSHMEGMPNAVLEAHAAELPVVASAVGGLVEVVEHEVTGLLVPPADPEALAAALLRLISDQRLARRMAADGRQRAAERFGLAPVTRRYEELYDRLVGRS